MTWVKQPAARVPLKWRHWEEQGRCQRRSLGAAGVRGTLRLLTAGPAEWVRGVRGSSQKTAKAHVGIPPPLEKGPKAKQVVRAPRRSRCRPAPHGPGQGWRALAGPAPPPGDTAGAGAGLRGRRGAAAPRNRQEPWAAFGREFVRAWCCPLQFFRGYLFIMRLSTRRPHERWGEGECSKGESAGKRGGEEIIQSSW